MNKSAKSTSNTPSKAPSERHAYRRLLGYTRNYIGLFILAVIGMALFSSADAAFMWLVKPLLDEGFAAGDQTVVTSMPWAIIVVFLIKGTGGFLSTFFMASVARRVVQQLRNEVVGQYLRLPQRFFDTASSGEMISLLTFNIEQLASAASDALKTLIQDSIKIVLFLAIMFYMAPKLAAFTLIVTPVIAIVLTTVNRHFRRYSQRIQESMGGITHATNEVVDGQREVKIFGGQACEQQRFGKVNAYSTKQQLKLAAMEGASIGMMQLIASVAVAGIIYFATNGSTNMTAGTFVAFMGATIGLLGPLKALTKVSVTLQRGVAAADTVFAVLDAETERDNGQRQLSHAQGEVGFHQVNFAYQLAAPSETEQAEGEDSTASTSAEMGLAVIQQPASEPASEPAMAASNNVLHDINLHIKVGETVAFVGQSGSGKTTLVSLLPRFYDVLDGHVTLDGQKVQDYALQDLRRQISLVSQQVTLFNDTVARNIAYGEMSHASRDEIIAAAKAANAWSFIEKMEQGLDTMIGEDGVLLSGGQRQRIAIARALLKDSAVLILDEATSALDTESERRIQAALERLMQNRTTLVIAHRLSTIETADRIVVMDDGRILEIGSHSELLARGGTYARLHAMQFSDGASDGAGDGANDGG